MFGFTISLLNLTVIACLKLPSYFNNNSILLVKFVSKLHNLSTNCWKIRWPRVTVQVKVKKHKSFNFSMMLALYWWWSSPPFYFSFLWWNSLYYFLVIHSYEAGTFSFGSYSLKQGSFHKDLRTDLYVDSAKLITIDKLHFGISQMKIECYSIWRLRCKNPITNIYSTCPTKSFL